MIRIQTYQSEHCQGIIDLILPIQQIEFQVPITLEDQPDLLEIPAVYMHGNGNFWVATNGENQIVGTIAFIGFGGNRVALRKMFVAAAYRGKTYGLAQQLMDMGIEWCQERQIESMWLGTVPKLEAAVRFYEKNGFDKVAAENLPPEFPRMAVDTLFFCKFV
ncbi:GNAT family N-acetyltransferase [Haliscomenobacter sp.]|uniref:GNAT family N-acetyltransferase n=1 Tax=Haliscomenobacter sp. TaxID=2717303 RepID=UPI003364B443